MKLGKDGTRYVRGLTFATAIKTIPNGLRLVHNFEPGHPDRQIGYMGFRAWWEKADAKGRRFVCHCGWAPHLKRHYDSDAWYRKGESS